MPTFRIGETSGGYLTVDVYSRAYSTATDYWDGNWLRARIEVSAGSFRGRVEALIRSEEILSFRDEVARVVDGGEASATFSTMEDWLTIELRRGTSGLLAVRGELCDEPGIGNTLTFHVAGDWVSLPTLRTALDKVMDAFPVLGAPDR